MAFIACGIMHACMRLCMSVCVCVCVCVCVSQAWAKLECELGNHSMAKTLCERALKVNPHHVPSHMVGTTHKAKDKSCQLSLGSGTVRHAGAGLYSSLTAAIMQSDL